MKKHSTPSLFLSASQWFYILLMPILISGCLFEHPEATEDGAIGVDPTLINIEAQLSINLNIPSLNTNKTRATDEVPHRLRLIVEVYDKSNCISRQVTYPEVEPNQTLFVLPLSLQLHAQHYQLVAWADYVPVNKEESLFYETGSLYNVFVCQKPYTGNTIYQDAFYSSTTLDLRPYRHQWNVIVPIQASMTRPLVRYNLHTTDLAEFVQRIKNGQVEGKQFTATVRYGFYLPTGFNALKGIATDSKMNIQYSRPLSLSTEEMNGEYCIAFDYVFVNNEDSFVWLTIDITNEKGILVARTQGVRVPYRRDHMTTVYGNFLTAPVNRPGIEIDTEYEGDIYVDLDKL